MFRAMRASKVLARGYRTSQMPSQRVVRYSRYAESAWLCQTASLGSVRARTAGCRCSNNNSMSTSSSATDESSSKEEECFVASAFYDNDAHKRFTLLELEAADYPGLIRVVSWLLNGMQLRVENAHIETDDYGGSKHTYWLVNYKGHKLSDDEAIDVAERLEAFISTCRPKADNSRFQDCSKDHIRICNTAHPQFTKLIVDGEPEGNRPGWLLELASVINGVGLTIHEALIQGCTDADPDLAVASSVDNSKEYDPKSGRRFNFWVTDRRNDKLDFSHALALTYTLGLVFGQNNGPLVAPNLDLTIT